GFAAHSLVPRFTDGAFEPCLKPAVRVDFKIKETIADGHAVQLAIWDTAGQECFRTLTPNFTAVKVPFPLLPVYDVTRKDTFVGLERWLNDLETYTTKSNTVKMLAGSKTEKVNLQIGLQFAMKHSLLFIKTSAKTQDGVQHAFEELVIKILQTPGLWNKSTEKARLQL
ncbi:Ras-related protein Rab-18-B, partial [Merops nubicus]